MTDEGLPPEEIRPLSPEERSRLADWYQKYGERVVVEVRRQLRAWAAGTAAGHSAVAQSVWKCIANHHIDEVMKVDLNDAQSAEALLVSVACRHCWRPNKQAQRHPPAHLEDAGRPGEEGAAFDPEDETRAVSPIVAAITRELEALLSSLSGPTQAAAAARALTRVEGGIELIARLNDRQRQVLALKIAGRKRSDIANDLGLDLRDVDRSWKAVETIAKSLSA